MSDAIDKTWQAIDEDMHREEAKSALHLGRSGLRLLLAFRLDHVATSIVICSYIFV